MGPITGLLKGFWQAQAFVIIGIGLAAIAYAYKTSWRGPAAITMSLAIVLWYVSGVVFISVLG